MSIKKMSKIVTVLLIVATILSAFSMVFATVEIPGSSNAGYSGSGLDTTVSNIIGIIQFICYAAAVIMIVILGVKFMTASPDGKAEIKKSAIIYVVGAVLVFAAGALLTLVRNVAGQTVGGGNATTTTPAQ